MATPIENNTTSLEALYAEVDALPDRATLIAKSVTENGTYNASDDDADGYSGVVVNVSGGGPSEPYASLEQHKLTIKGNIADINSSTLLNAYVPAAKLGDFLASIDSCFLSYDSYEVVLPDGLETISALASAYLDISELPSSLKTISDYGLYGCTGIHSLTVLPSTILTIGDRALGNTSIRNIEIAAQHLGDCVFEMCGSLTKVWLRSSCTSLGSRLFESCDTLDSLQIYAEPNTKPSGWNSNFNLAYDPYAGDDVRVPVIYGQKTRPW